MDIDVIKISAVIDVAGKTSVSLVRLAPKIKFQKAVSNAAFHMQQKRLLAVALIVSCNSVSAVVLRVVNPVKIIGSNIAAVCTQTANFTVAVFVINSNPA